MSFFATKLYNLESSLPSEELRMPSTFRIPSMPLEIQVTIDREKGYTWIKLDYFNT